MNDDAVNHAIDLVGITDKLIGQFEFGLIGRSEVVAKIVEELAPRMAPSAVFRTRLIGLLEMGLEDHLDCLSSDSDPIDESDADLIREFIEVLEELGVDCSADRTKVTGWGVRL